MKNYARLPLAKSEHETNGKKNYRGRMFAIRIIRIRDVALNSAKDEGYIVVRECSENNKKLAGLQDENCSGQSCT